MSRIDLERVQDFVPKFHEFLNAEGAVWQAERNEKDKFFARHFGRDALEELEEGTLRQLIHTLWAFNGWTNKDWLLKELLQSGLPTIRKAFDQLLYGDDPIRKRFDHVRTSVRMMGAASISEILAHHDHSQYPIWNSRAREGLVLLGIADELLPKSSQISGAQYETFCELMQNVQQEIAREFEEFEDLFTLDYLLYYASVEAPESGVPVKVSEEISDFDHDGVIDQLLELGDGLGFEVEKEFAVLPGCRIDAIWRSRVANLGTITYAFEVHRRGSRDSAILNLQRIRRDPSIRRVVVVSNSTEIAKFKQIIESLDEGFRTAIGYFEVGDLERALNHLQELKDILRGLGLLASEGSL